jgi:hypothetical protein
MTAIVTQSTIAALNAADYEIISAIFGGLAVVLLLVLLGLKEFVRSRPGQQRPALLRVFDIAAFPLLFTFMVVLVLRLLSLINL